MEESRVAKNMTDPLREQVASLLDWGEAHVGFDRAVAGIAPRFRSVVPAGLPYSAWQLLEHLRIAQADILEFCRSARYKEKKWPDDYWPASPRPASAAAWTRSITAFRRDRRALQRLARNTKIDLFATIPHGSGQTYLRELLLIADHTAYHVGQIVIVRRALGIW
jgi:DinB family protein